MTFRGTCYSDLEFVAELFTNESYQICCIMEITAGSGLAQRNISAESQHMIYALIQVMSAAAL